MLTLSNRTSLALSEENSLTSFVTLEKAVGTDFERVYPLLLDFNTPGITRESWRRLFTNDWKNPEDFCGYLLLDAGTVNGFLGLLFSARTMNGQSEKFCNMTSWIVRPEYRNHSLRLLVEALKLQDLTITNFTASRTVAEILKKVGFAELTTSHRMLFPIPSPFIRGSKYRCIFEGKEIRQVLSETDQAIFDDHRHSCRHVLIFSRSHYCYLVVKNKVHRHLPFARVHYLSNRAFFADALDFVRNRICRRLRVVGLMIDERYLGDAPLCYSANYPQQCPAFFKSNTLTADDIDTLYSEMILLHD